MLAQGEPLDEDALIKLAMYEARFTCHACTKAVNGVIDAMRRRAFLHNGVGNHERLLGTLSDADLAKIRSMPGVRLIRNERT